MLESWVRFSVLLSIGVAVLTLALTAFLLLRAFDQDSSLRKLSGQQIQDGVRLDAELLSIRQTGLLVNQKPMMRLELKVSQDGFSRELTIEQLIDLGNMPRAGERVEIMVDRQNPARASYLRPASAVRQP
ncbi:hypothetical protein [Chromobacterium aquaticum]|uniref:Uncharacterized protein n=1 Tax=Chromobacterium aquaticum TaxID=467180 RepID=A0ABV8ZS08_9NEIS|nr:hypothetical protein [Chromobacterium aquaticum]MCD5361448.1 hypothetical protein [Chromobacterium aquaticum]